MRAKITKKLIESLKPKEKQYEVRDAELKGLMVRVMPTGTMTYAVEYGRGRKFTIGKANILTPVQARDKARQILADVTRGIDPQEAKRKAKAHTFESFLTQVYAPWVKTHHNDGDATIKRLKTNFFPILGKKKLADITLWQIEKWRSERLREGIKPATVNRDISPLKAALTRAVDWGLIENNPLSRIKPQKVDSHGVIRYLADDEEERLRDALDYREERLRLERDSANAWRKIRGYTLLPDLRKLPFADYLKPMVILDLHTGLRRGELFNLKWEDVDLNHAMLTVKGAGAKSGQTRHIPLNAEALDTLSRWKTQSKDSELVFPGKGGKRFNNVDSSWEKLMKDANITDFRFHDLRHTFASRLVMAGVDLNTVRELLGHSDIKMTLRYAHLAPEVKANAVARLVKPKIRETQNLKKTMVGINPLSLSKV